MMKQVTLRKILIVCIFVLITVFNNVNSVMVMSKRDARKIHHNLMTIIKLCFSDQLSTFVSTSDVSEIFHRNPGQNVEYPVIFIDTNIKNNEEPKRNFASRWPIIILSPKSENELLERLESVKESKFWNIEYGLFFLIEKNPNQACGNVSKILRAAWKMNLVLVFFICEEDDKIKLYTFNPFMDNASNPWIKVDNSNKFDSQWTLYTQSLNSEKENCPSLNFDRTVLLNGYKIKVGMSDTKPGVKSLLNVDYTLKDLKNQQEDYIFYLFENVCSLMNVTPVIRYDTSPYWVNHQPSNSLKRLINGTYDLFFDFRHMNSKIGNFFPIMQTKLKIITQNRKFLEPIEKMWQFYSNEIKGLTLLVLIVTCVVMTFNARVSISEGFFETLRYLLCTGVRSSLNLISIRIYYSSLCLLIIILEATFKGNLSAFMTQPTRHDIETINHLKQNKFHVYIGKLHRDIVEYRLREIPEKYLHYIEHWNCTNNALNDYKAACIMYVISDFELARGNNLHISEAQVSEGYVTNYHRSDWPLVSKMNNVLILMFELGLVKHGQDKIIERERKMRSLNNNDMIARYRPLKLRDLAFFFKSFIIGIAISTLFLILELGRPPLVRTRKKHP